MRSAALGRQWGFDYAGSAAASLMRVDAGGTVHVAALGLMLPNGTAVTPAAASLIVAETVAARLTAFRIGADGSLGERCE